MYIYKYKNNIHIHIIFSSHLHPSAPAKTRSAAQRLKKRRVLRSQRGLPFSLSPMRTTSKSQSPVRERVSKEGNQIGKQPLFMGSCKKWVTSCFLHTGLLPRYPILHSWDTTNGSSMVKTKHIERIEHPTMAFLVAAFTPWQEFESQLRIISGWNK